ncbi:uncharacterized protein B0P05DRAFT_591546 [Gilbertella persicaria]|uniref:uncharacterized protein n=1 Tax=Gilbertella persicaria TaxID=101096 RepID=UPI00221F21B3|nr:uncharacterized protein B0P05DRAFT_591546 [Gilbertella persicaria]KAI8054151.1 hypothetical protein B0P05DRAFT_591546 [Gilbertella persicaria]
MSFMSGADCGPVNPMSGLLKQLGQDRSLQQDRFGPEQQGESSKAGFRTRQTMKAPMQGSQMADEFFRDEMNMDRPATNVFQFNGLHHELDRIQPDWTQDFMQHQQPAHHSMNEFEKIYQQHQRPAGPVDWHKDFEAFEGNQVLHAQEREAFEKAFDQARQGTPQAVNWEQEFTAQESSWATEFEAQEEKTVMASTDNEALAKTAGMLLDSVDIENNPKFKQSQFMHLMRQLRDSEVAIQGDRMVETKSGHDWASDFQKDKEGDWTTEFTQHAGSKGNMWSTEFATKLERGWTDEFHQQHKQHQQPGEWSAEFNKYPADMQTLFTKAADKEDWVEQYNKNIAHLKNAQDHAWDAMQKDWEQFRPEQGMGYRATNPEYNTYHFSTQNPYLLQPELIDQGIHSDHLADAILALEAKTQLQTSDANAWKTLGLRQQENERDGAAIAALRQALTMNPGLLDGWLALAVSYTNENCRADAYDALEQWIANHDRYRHLATGKDKMGPEGRHGYITNMFLEAARSSPGEEMDADVQVGLGVLFNVSEEYDKAIDCFKAALTSKPQDYLLWNKLGATLANSRNAAGAIDAYFTALEISPTYVRARYNLAISCINLGQQREAAEHLLTALALQKSNDGSNGAGGSVMIDEHGQHIPVPGGMSDNIWSSLRMLMSREDLARECDQHNLNAFRSEFEF